MHEPTTRPTIGPYQAVRALGAGAAGQVWLAKSPTGPVALKTAHTPDGRALLRREAGILSRLDHRYVVQLVDSDLDGQWLALEYVDGPTLDTWGRNQPIGRTIELAARLCEAVAHVHDTGILHGDLKPGNVMVDEYGCPRIIDLGTARLVADVRAPKGFHGTLGYAAPELLIGEVPGPAADIYSLGALLYRLLTSNPPFRSADPADPAALAYLPLSSYPEPPSAYVPRLPSALEDLVLSMMARDPARRPVPASGLPPLLRAALRTSPKPPIVGMSRERAGLRKAVAATMDGKPGVVVLHGVEGSGRRTLIREALTTGRREGANIVEGVRDPRALLEHLRHAGAPTLIATEANGRDTTFVAGRIFGERLPALLLVRAARPLMTLTNLGARHLSPAGLTSTQVAMLLEAYGLDATRAADIHQRTRGLPGAVVGYAQPPAEGIEGVTDEQRELLRATASQAVPIADLARMLGVGEHTICDWSEALLDRGLLQEVEDGTALQAVRGDA
ncbi:MAG: serine/threonine-protein kinase PknK [Proteobacteria bacterium]|nr:serine/threonine-protein kinase PknK [Pseudomonadota bacterium]MCP4920123.1 serine/threonine-protein kinase PknK [Pseudomonadota bacterium]